MKRETPDGSRERKLKAECMRLSEEVTLLREREEQIRANLIALRSSLTWTLATRLNRWAAALLRIRRGPTAWMTLEQLLRESGGTRRRSVESRMVIERARGRHAEAATHALGLAEVAADATLLGPACAPPPPAGLLLTGLGCEPPELSAGEELLLGLRVAEPGALGGYEPAVVGAFLGASATLSAVQALAQRCEVLGAELVVLQHPELPDPPGWFRDWVDEPLSSRVLAAVHDDTGMALRRLAHELNLRGRAVKIAFSPASYLAANPDVAQAVADGVHASAEDHWNTIGATEFVHGSRAYQARAEPLSLGLRRADARLAERAAKEIEGWARRPRISVLVPVYRVELRWLKAAVESVQAQLYPHWELCLVDDASGDAGIRAFLEGLDDGRIKVRLLEENVGIARATQAALELASGDFVALLDHDDALTVDALWLVARAIVEHDPDILYSDEAKLDEKDRPVEPHFKPDFSREMILSQNYISHLGVYRTALARDAGGFRPGFEGSQDHDFLLRCLARARRIFHLPRVLYYWRKVPGSTAARFADKSHAWDAGVRAVGEAVALQQPDARCGKARFPGTYRVRRPLDHSQRVAVIIPFRDAPKLLDACLDSLIDTLPADLPWEIIGVDNQSFEAQTHATMERWAARDRRIRFIDYDAPFNFSAINNAAALATEADQLLFLNNDITAIEAGWLEAMLEFSQLPDVGAVGAKLLYPDDTLQHAGVVLGIGGVAGHSHKYFPESHHGYFCRPHLIQNVSAVTGACLMVKRRLFVGLGGFNAEHLAVAFNDIDFCLRLLEAGYRNVYTPFARLYHHESKSRGHEDTPEKQARFGREAGYMRRRHNLALSSGDHWYNPNLTLVHENFAVREP